MVRGLTRTARAATSVVIQPESPDMSVSLGRDCPRLGSSAIEGYLTPNCPLAARLGATSCLWAPEKEETPAGKSRARRLRCTPPLFGQSARRGLDTLLYPGAVGCSPSAF